MKGERMGSNGRPGGKADGEIRKVVSALWKRRNLYLHALFGITQEFHLKRLTGTPFTYPPYNRVKALT